MKIKKRLFISNILMVLIPIILGFIISFLTLIIFFISISQNSETNLKNDLNLNNILSKIKKIIEEDEININYSNNNLYQQLDDYIDKNKMYLEIIKNDKIIFYTGNKYIKNISSENISKFTKNVEKCTISKEDVMLNFFLLSKNGDDYYIFLYNKISDIKYKNLKQILLILIIILSVILSVILINKILVNFVFKHISNPLLELKQGVYRIRDGQLDYRITYFNDDEFKSIFEDFNQMANKLQSSVEIIKKQEQNRKDLLVAISHDLRSPLTSLNAYSQGLLDNIPKTEDDKNNYLKIIRDKTILMDKMINKLFIFSKMDFGEYPYNFEKLNLEDEIDEFVNNTKIEFKNKGLNLHWKNNNKNIFIFADPIQLKSILINIIENSLKYKIKDEVNITIKCNCDDNFSIMSIKDDGPGVDDDKLNKIFDLFYRTDISRNNVKNGSGLGLAIVKKSIENLNGNIIAENTKPNGLKFIIKLPLFKENINEKNINN